MPSDLPTDRFVEGLAHSVSEMISSLPKSPKAALIGVFAEYVLDDPLRLLVGKFQKPGVYRVLAGFELAGDSISLPETIEKTLDTIRTIVVRECHDLNESSSTGDITELSEILVWSDEWDWFEFSDDDEIYFFEVLAPYTLKEIYETRIRLREAQENLGELLESKQKIENDIACLSKTLGGVQQSITLTEGSIAAMLEEVSRG